MGRPCVAIHAIHLTDLVQRRFGIFVGRILGRINSRHTGIIHAPDPCDNLTLLVTGNI